MNIKNYEANLLALKSVNPEIYSLLSAKMQTLGKTDSAKYYTFSEARSGEIVPVFSQSYGNSKPLHSMVDPKREAERLISTITTDTGFLVFLGLGGGFAPQAALENTAAQVLVIDFDIDAAAELFSAIDYTALFKNERFTLLLNPSCEKIKNFILEHYKPSLCGGIKTFPLRTRIESDLPQFDAASAAIQEAIDIVSADYSVQAHFGRRWFSNIIRNLKFAETVPENTAINYFSTPVHEAAIAAAGPSLDQQIPELAEYKSRQVFIICADTALPVLLHNGIEPDAVVSIDCQHISYYHFLYGKLRRGFRGIPLVLDIASPPLLSRLSHSPVFFSSGHPLAQYVSNHCRRFPALDTSGGNVTYACLSLAEYLGAQRITLFGADFSYVNSRSYARGTYIFPFFEKKQNRFSGLEAMFSGFLYRSPFLPPENGKIPADRKNYYETSSLRFYRKKLEEKAAMMSAQVYCAKGSGAPVNLNKAPGVKIKQTQNIVSAEKSKISCIDFLEQYRKDIAALPAGGVNYLRELNEKNKQILFTLLPSAAAIKHRNPALKANDLIEKTKQLCIKDIERVLASPK